METQTIKENLLKNNVDFFKNKIPSYKTHKIEHLSVLGFALHNSSYEVVEQILKNNGAIISINLNEEDSFNTYFCLLERNASFEEKCRITDLFEEYVKGFDFNFYNSRHNFIAYCIGRNQIDLLLYIYEKDKKGRKLLNIEDLMDYKEDIYANLNMTNNPELLVVFEQLVE